MKNRFSVIIAFFCVFCAACELNSDFPQEIDVTEPPINGAFDPVVHQPFTYVGTQYEGITSQPDDGHFQADAFFMIKGSVTSPDPAFQYTYIEVIKLVPADQSQPKTAYWARGSFLKRIWLRFGSGDYTVNVHYAKVNNPNLNYNGDILNYTYWETPAHTFSVTNIRNEDGTFYYPSDPVQSDDPAIAAQAASIIADAGAGADTEAEKILALHDWIVKNLYYDFTSLADGRRQKQDAITTLDNGNAVCEGYTSLYNAFLRSIGIHTKCIRGLGGTTDHAWSKLYTTGQWLNVDTTWDDPIMYDGTSNHPDGSNLSHAWYLLPGDNFDRHTFKDDRIDRSIAPLPADEGAVATQMTWRGYPPGVY